MPETTEAQQLLLANDFGILCTHSVELEGYPFGSVTPYCLDYHYRPVVLISTIAQHTKNIKSNNKVSLTVLQGYAEDDPQSKGRVTYIADAIKVEGADFEATSSRYYRYFPQAKDYHSTHDFEFYALEPKRIRYIGGFGKIFWIEKNEFTLKNPFDATTESKILDHMNQDHTKALRRYCTLLEVNPGEEKPTMAGIDAWGFDLLVGKKRHRLNFDSPISTMDEARKALVALSKE